MQVPPRFELELLDSKSRVLTITPWDRDKDMECCIRLYSTKKHLFLDYENNLAEFRYAKEQIKGNES